MDSTRGSRPQKTSTVATSGRQLRSISTRSQNNNAGTGRPSATHLRGTFVIGIIAIENVIQMDKNGGYSSTVRTFAVTSSLIVLPNIIQPRTAMTQSKEYCKASVNRNDRLFARPSYRKNVGRHKASSVFVRMPHIPVYVGKYPVTSPRR